MTDGSHQSSAGAGAGCLGPSLGAGAGCVPAGPQTRGQRGDRGHGGGHGEGGADTELHAPLNQANKGGVTQGGEGGKLLTCLWETKTKEHLSLYLVAIQVERK